jgi:tyrosyl-DNA phosphodiesterase 2
MKPIRIATTQLECPSPPAPMHCMERYIQAEHAVVALGSAANVVFGGDMSWDDNTDLPFPLPAGWVDAWTLMKPHEVGTGSSSTRSGDWIEPFRAGGLCNAPRKRSDRFACKLRDYELRIVTYRA